MPTKLNRRDFIKLTGSAGTALIFSGCRQQAASSIPSTPPTRPIPTVTSIPATPTLSPATVTPQPTPIPTASPTPTPTSTPDRRTRVAIGQAGSYDPKVLRKQLEQMLTDLGGLADLVRPGARVGIKPNLTGGSWWDSPQKPPAVESFVTHPTIIRVLAELLQDAGAGKIYIVEGIDDESCIQKWGFAEMVKPLNAKIINLCQPAPYASFIPFPVGSKPFIYENYYLHPLLKELDVFISVAKMKCHQMAGVTLALKNLVGLTPLSEYTREPQQTSRTALHGPVDFDSRLPRVIVDLNRARPIDLAIIDGVMTVEGGEGPWQKTMSQVKPELLVASRDSVAADAVSTALMGFDPQVASGQLPFVRFENYLALADESGLGSHRLEEIRVIGAPIDQVKYPFKPVP